MIKITMDQFNLEIDRPQWMMILKKDEGKMQEVLGILNGKADLSEGQYFFKGKDVSTFSQREMAQFRKKEVVNLSEPNFLMENFTIEKNLQLQLKSSGIYPTKGKKMIVSTLELMEMKELLDVDIPELSPLQKLQVRLAKAVVVEPKLICGVDPFIDLSEDEINIVKGWIDRLIEKGIIIIMITPHPNHLKYGEQQLILEN